MGRFFVSLLVYAVFSSGVFAEDCPSRLLGHRFRNIESASGAVRFLEAFPNFDVENDMVFFFHPDFHASLFAADYYWNHQGGGAGAELTYHEHPKAIRRGIAVRVRIGKMAVDALRKTFVEQSAPRAHTNSCHINQLAFLQRHGVYLQGGAKVAATSTLRAILGQGFADKDGNQLPTQEIVAIVEPGSPIAQHIEGSLDTYNAVSVSHLTFALGISNERLLEAVKQHCKNAEVQGLVARKHIPFESPILSALVRRLEGLAFEKSQNYFGLSSHELLEIVAYQRESIPVDVIEGQLGPVIAEACQELEVKGTSSASWWNAFAFPGCRHASRPFRPRT